jgi:hypothetical protein
VRAAAVDPNVLLTVVFVSWVALFALVVVVVVRHERSRDAAISAGESPAGSDTQGEDPHDHPVPPRPGG